MSKMSEVDIEFQNGEVDYGPTLKLLESAWISDRYNKTEKMSFLRASLALRAIANSRATRCNGRKRVRRPVKQSGVGA